MRAASLYGHVAELYDLHASSRLPADLLLRDFTRKRRYLGARDRRFIGDTFFDLLRHHLRLEQIVRGALKGLVPDRARVPALGVGLCAAHAIHLLGRTPEEILPDLGGLWRTVTSDVDPGRFFSAIAAAVPPEAGTEPPSERLSRTHSIPIPLVTDILGLLGEEEGAELCHALNTPAPVTVRVNTLRTGVQECQDGFSRLGIPVRRTQLSPDGLTLERRMDLSGLPIFRQGWFEPQDEGSQLLGRLLSPVPGSTVVDACAGGGGKSLHAAALMRNEGRILALDVEEGRLRRLRERARRGGATIIEARVVPERGPLAAEWVSTADAVLVDAPCSGTGTYRRNPGAKMRFAQMDLPGMTHLQNAILDRSAHLVRPGGRLLYSTCSLMREENEGVVSRFLAGHPEFQVVPAGPVLLAQGIQVSSGERWLHLLPHLHGTDAFFAALLIRGGG
jgi:16S rRNA (cytosine967-C5)-methyltransferase